MIEYTIISISFAMVVYIRYVWETLNIVKDVIALMCLETEAKFSPVFFSIVFFMFTAITMPAFAIYIAWVPRKVIIHELSTAILTSYLKLEKK